MVAITHVRKTFDDEPGDTFVDATVNRDEGISPRTARFFLEHLHEIDNGTVYTVVDGCSCALDLFDTGKQVLIPPNQRYLGSFG